MIYSYNTTEQEIGVNEALVFDIDEVKTGTTVLHAPGTSIFTLVKPGYYYVTVTAVGVASATGTDPIVLALYNGSNTIAGATSSVVSASTTDIVSLTINTIIPVRPSCCAIDNTVYLALKNIGVAANYTNVTITITKLS